MHRDWNTACKEKRNMIKKERVAWLDVAKCLGIFAVYIGHFGKDAGLIYDYVFQFHVPLFFFLAGCTRRISAGKPLDSVKQATKNLLIPFFLFGLIYLALLALVVDSLNDTPGHLLILLKGAPRNQFAAGSLWFLTCLWVIEVLFSLIQRWKWFLQVPVSIGLYLIATKVLPWNPLFEPRGWYNVDSALAYFLYFVLGYTLFPVLEKWFHTNQDKRKIALHSVGVLSLAYGVFVFQTQARYHVQLYLNVPGYDVAGTILHTCILVFSAVYAARLLQGVGILRRTGQDTLNLCGNEDAVRMLFPIAWKTIGLNIQFVSPMSFPVYAVVLIGVVRKLITPAERNLFRRIMRRKESESFGCHSHAECSTILGRASETSGKADDSAG